MTTNWFNWDEKDDDTQRPWTLADIYDDLGSRRDVAEYLNITIWRMNRWIFRRERIRCPHPVKRISGVDIYSKNEWKTWFAQWSARTSPGMRSYLNEKSKPYGSGESFFTHGGLANDDD